MTGKYKLNVGDVYTANCGTPCKVVERIDTMQVVIEWQDEFKHRQTARPERVMSGKVYNPYFKAHYGIGYAGFGKYLPARDKTEYMVWKSMLRRAYNKDYKDWKPTYSDCIVCEEWHNFQNFAEWYNGQKFAHMEGYQLDKDIIYKGNKIYSPEFCSLVPREINMLLVTRKSNRGELPIGVHLDKKIKSENRYCAQFKDLDGSVKSKHFDCPVKAFMYYKENKELVIKKYAEKYKNSIDNKVYIALYNYKVEITD